MSAFKNNFKKVWISVFLILLLISVENIARPGRAGGSRGGRGFAARGHSSRAVISQPRSFSHSRSAFRSRTSPRLQSSSRLSTRSARRISSPRFGSSPRISRSSPRIHSSPRIRSFRQPSIRHRTSSRSFNRSRKFTTVPKRFHRRSSITQHPLTAYRQSRSNSLNAFRDNRLKQSSAVIGRSIFPSRSPSIFPSTGKLSSHARLYPWYGKSHRGVYRERSDYKRNFNRHHFYFRDKHDRFRNLRTSPRHRFNIRYKFGRSYKHGYIRPYYHQKYVFVSLGGYWPGNYDYYRYYTYGGHPYYWYGYNPVAYPVSGSAYDYTYSYPYQAQEEYDDFSDVRERLQREKEQSSVTKTTVDVLFESGVKYFEKGNYDMAAGYFEKAAQMDSDDIILPYAYVQALFAGGKYHEAAVTLRSALEKVDPEKPGVYYPRGLYEEEKVLLGQVDNLNEKVILNATDSDLQLLLGYQFVGLGQLENAVEYLEQAKTSDENRLAADVLLTMIEKIRLAGSDTEELDESTNY